MLRARCTAIQLGANEPIAIGSNVWIGSRVTVLKGVRIGDGAVIAAGFDLASVASPRRNHLIRAGAQRETCHRLVAIGDPLGDQL